MIGDQTHEITVVKVVLGIIIAGSALFELLPQAERLSFDRRYLPLGGLLSGFFGGLSGYQGALRSAFLIRAGLAKEAFIGTGTVSAVMVDGARLLVYGASFYALKFGETQGVIGLVIAATVAAFLGAFAGQEDNATHRAGDHRRTAGGCWPGSGRGAAVVEVKARMKKNAVCNTCTIALVRIAYQPSGFIGTFCQHQC